MLHRFAQLRPALGVSLALFFALATNAALCTGEPLPPAAHTFEAQPAPKADAPFPRTVSAAPAGSLAPEAEKTAVTPPPPRGTTGPSGVKPAGFSERPQLSWPIYYHRTFGENHERYIFGPLWLYEKDHDAVSHYPIWPLLGSQQSDRERTLDLVWPFTGYQRDPSGTRVSIIRPFTEVKSQGGSLTNLDLFWPFTGYEKTPGETRYRLLWPFTEYHADAAGTDLDLLWPFATTREKSWTRGRPGRPDQGPPVREYQRYRYLLRPLIGWEEKGVVGEPATAESLCLAPLYCSAKDEQSAFHFVAPSLFWGENTRENKRWSTLFPFYLKKSAPDQEALFLFPSYWHQEQSFSGGNRSTTALFPFYFSDRRPGGSARYIFPTIWLSEAKKSDGTSSATTSVLPFFSFMTDGPGQSDHFAFPSAIWGSSPRGSYYGLIPFVFNREQGPDRLFYAFPTYYRRETPEYRTTWAIPFFTTTHDLKTNEEFRSILWPLYYHRENQGKGTFYTSLLWPIYIAKKEEDQSEAHSFFWPLYLSRNNPKKHSAYRGILWPAFIQTAEGDTEETSFFGHLYYDFQSPEKKRWDLLPFCSITETPAFKETTWWPLLARRHDDRAQGTTRWESVVPLSIFSKIPPIYYSDYDPATQHSYRTVLWPLTAFEQEPAREKVRVWPYSYEYDRVANFRSHHLFWPLFSAGSGPEESTGRALPLFAYTRGHDFGSTFVLPFYFDRWDPVSSDRVVFPLYWSHLSPEGSRTTIPLVSWKRSTLGDATSFTLFPFLHLEREPTKSRTLVLPFYYGDRREESTTTVVFPVYLKHEDQKSALTVVPPVGWSDSSAGHSLAIFPLYYQSEGGGTRAHLLGPVFWSSAENEKNRFVFFPLFWRSWDRTSSSFTLFPLFNTESDLRLHTSSYSLLWRLYHHEEKPEQSKTVGLFGLYQKEERPGYRLNRCRPFFEYEKQSAPGREETFFSLLFELYRHRRVNDQVEVRLFFIPIYRK